MGPDCIVTTATPCDRARGVGHLSNISQKMGIANFPVVLLRRVTETSNFHGSFATISGQCDKPIVKVKKTRKVATKYHNLGS